MQLLYGTGNPGKIEWMNQRVEGLNIELIGLHQLEQQITEPPETGNTPLENARQKAMYYHQMTKMPVFSCDSGLYIEELPEELQPGVHVRNVNGVHLCDEEMLEYYSGLAKEYGNLTARYINAICLVMNENEVYEGVIDGGEKDSFLLVAEPHDKRIEGLPLDSLAVHMGTGQYFYDLDEEEIKQEKTDKRGYFYQFFQQHLGKIKVHFYDQVEDEKLDFAVILSKADDKWVLCKHKERNTFEVPGGHRERGESIEEAAKRELYEETGALNYQIQPVCAYSVERYREESYGMLFYAEITEFGTLPEMEMERLVMVEDWKDLSPNMWTYPEIQPQLMERVNREWN